MLLFGVEPSFKRQREGIEEGWEWNEIFFLLTTKSNLQNIFLIKSYVRVTIAKAQNKN